MANLQRKRERCNLQLPFWASAAVYYLRRPSQRARSVQLHFRSVKFGAGDQRCLLRPNSSKLSARNARVGLVLFVLYLAFYAGFMGLNAFSPLTMKWTPLGGANLAILYGLGLIVGAVLIALVYMFLCKRNADQHAEELRS